MYKKHKLAVLIPCYNAEDQIKMIVNALPDIVDDVVVIDDCSTDKTVEALRMIKENSHITLLRNEVSQGIDRAIASGYEWARDNNADIAVVLAGDGQIDPMDITSLLDPIIDDGINYSKANRITDNEGDDKASLAGSFKNSSLSLMTKISSGYWHISDSQSICTAADKKVLHKVNWQKISARHGLANTLLIKLNVLNCRVRDVSFDPVYTVGETNNRKGSIAFFKISKTLIKGFFWRMKNKYIIRNFHPLVLFYMLGIFMLSLGLLFFIRFIWVLIAAGEPPLISLLSMFFMWATGLQCVFFGMLFDIQDNKDLR